MPTVKVTPSCGIIPDNYRYHFDKISLYSFALPIIGFSAYVILLRDLYRLLDSRNRNSDVVVSES